MQQQIGFLGVVCLTLIASATGQDTTKPTTGRKTDSPPSQTIWTLAPAERTALLAEQIKQAEITRQEYIDLQSQIQAACASQQQAQLLANQAQLDTIRAKAQANQSIQQASQAALQAGFEAARADAESRLLPERINMSISTVERWEAPKGYKTARSPAVALDDPFAPPALGKTSVSEPMQKLLEGTCLILDEEHDVAKVQRLCWSAGEKLLYEVGDYPILSDGRPVDSPDTVKEFLKMSSEINSKLFALRGDMRLVVLR